MLDVFAVTDFLDSPRLHGSLGLLGAAVGFWAGTKLRNVTGETGLPGLGAIAGAVLFYLLAPYLTGLALFAAAGLLLVLLIRTWPTIAQVILTFAQKLAAMLPSGFRSRSFHKRLDAEQREHERELERTRSLNVHPDVKRRLMEKLQNDHRDRLLELSDRRSKSKRP